MARRSKSSKTPVTNSAAFEYEIKILPVSLAQQAAIIAQMAKDDWRLVPLNTPHAGAIVGYFERRITSRLPSDLTLLEQVHDWFEQASPGHDGAEFLNDKGWDKADTLHARIKSRLRKAGIL